MRVASTITAVRVTRFRKFPTTSSFSCCPREILREWCFLNTEKGKFQSFHKERILVPAMVKLNIVDTR